MDSIKGLKEYVRHPFYREALGLPEEVTERYEMLAQGEYNRNYVFTHPVTGKKLVLRVNCGSQMHLRHQIEYEVHALKLLESWNNFGLSQRAGRCSRMSCRYSQCEDAGRRYAHTDHTGESAGSDSG